MSFISITAYGFTNFFLLLLIVCPLAQLVPTDDGCKSIPTDDVCIVSLVTCTESMLESLFAHVRTSLLGYSVAAGFIINELRGISYPEQRAS